MRVIANRWFLIAFGLLWLISTGGLARSAETPEETPSGTVGSSAKPAKRVLILYTHRQMSPVNAQWHTGIIEAIRKDYPGPLDVDLEYMDVVLQEDREYFNEWVSLLRRKYRKYPPDVVIPVFIPAVTFLLPNKEDLFPGCPVVFCAVPASFGKSQAERPDVTGVGFRLEFEASVGVIRKLLPQTKKLAVLSGNSKFDEFLRRSSIRRIRDNFPELEIVDLSGLSPSEVAVAMSNLGPDTAALLLTCELDQHNNRYTTTDYMQELKSLTSTPVFGCYDTVLGHGIVGGALVSPVEQGRMAGRLAAKILNGESAENIPEELSQSYSLAFDAEQLQRFGIPQNRLPRDSKVINRQLDVWRQYGRYFAIGLAALFAQSAIIVSLLINRRKRIAAEREARSLAGRILSAGEDERRYLARELHDDVSQRLAAVSIETGALENKMADSSEIKESLGNLKKSLKRICDDLHRMSRHMHPSVLDDFGLSDAIKSECSELARRWAIPIEFHHPKDFPEIPKSIALCLYRVAQEGLWNAVRHSKATKINIELKSDPEFVYLDIQDNGIGFDPSVTQSSRGLGLASMTERIRLAGGTIDIQAVPSQGVAIAVVVPIPETQSL
jgi:signal transduction histidine kinase